MSRYVAAIDQGTTSSRCIIFDAAGAIVASAQKEHRQIFPQPGWVEHDAAEIWANVQTVVAGALDKAGIGPGDLAAVGVTNQRETTVLWDRRTGKPIANAIVWQDTRTDRLARELGADAGPDRFRDLCGLPLATYFSGPKIRWLLDWDEALLDGIGVPRACLPQIVSSSEVYAPARGVLEGVAVAGALGDQQAALFGQTCFEPGQAKCTYGTGAFLLLNTGPAPVVSNRGLLTTLAYKIGEAPAVYALEGSIAMAGSLVQWLRDNLRMIEHAADIEALAASVEDTGGCVLVPAFSGLFAPHWRADARGVLAGLTGYVTRAHIARAALEATAWQVREVVDAMAADSGVPLTSLKADGGMTANSLLMQIQADVLDAPVICPAVVETTCLGAAYAAGLAVGYWPDQAALTANWRAARDWRPAMAADVRAEGYARWKKAVERTLGWVDE